MNTIEPTYQVILITRKEVESLSTERFIQFLQAGLDDVSDNSYDITFDGYDDDPRSVVQIPSIHRFMKKADSQFEGKWLNIRWARGLQLENHSAYTMIFAILVLHKTHKNEVITTEDKPIVKNILTRHTSAVYPMNVALAKDSLTGLVKEEVISQLLMKSATNVIRRSFFIEGYEVTAILDKSGQSTQARFEWSPTPKKLTYRMKMEYRKKRNAVMQIVCEETNECIVVVDTLDKEWQYITLKPGCDPIYEIRKDS